ncbi:DNA-methyltransferase [Marasmitruncus massiliensis]|uniref:DNA-methyltransferase n=1 Tax=Marasmitruncus massiliensis TaxID=1944642 RepID=UPI000C7C7418|nr:site-specific DNA-methyltransferase [Marasmitruncus massiliensis]
MSDINKLTKSEFEFSSVNILPNKNINAINIDNQKNIIFNGDVETFLDCLPQEPIFDLVVTSPPYNIGKEYERPMQLEEYLKWQKRIINKIFIRLKDTGSICWQVGNYVDNGSILPLDIEMAPIFKELGMKMRNRIVWHFGHGLHTKRRFSGRYEVVMWYSKTDSYVFNLDPVRIPAKYPGKKSFKGENKGKLSGNPKGKNPEDVWEVPNVKGNHIEKTAHPCQFPVGLIERLVLALTNEGQLVFDPFCGVASSGVAAIIHNRSFWGCELDNSYVKIGEQRLNDSIAGTIKYRPFNKPIYDHTKSGLSKVPDEWKKEGLDG